MISNIPTNPDDFAEWTKSGINDTTTTISQSAQNDGFSQSSQSGNEQTDKFAVLDSLRHKFDTHRVIKKTEYIGGLFPRGAVTVVAGAAGVGKTTFEQKIFHDLSRGGEILGGFWHETKPRKSIIIAAELGEDGLTERAQEFDWHSDMDYVEVIDMIQHSEKGILYTLNEHEGQANIEHLAKTPNLDLLFIDSFGMFYTGKESDNDALRAVFYFLMVIARKYDIAVVVIHHSRKRLSSEQAKPLTLDDLIGGNAIARYSHRVITIEYNDNNKANTVTCLKSWGQYFKHFTYSKKTDFYGHSYLEINLEPNDLDITPKTKKDTSTSNAEYLRVMTLAILKARDSKQATTQEIRDIIGIDDEKGKNSLKSVLKRMIDKGEITSNKRGIYTLPEPDKTDKKVDNEDIQPDDEILSFDLE